MDKKIFELSVLMNEADDTLYYDINLNDIENTENLLQVVKALQDMGNLLFDSYLGKIGVKIVKRKKSP